MNTIINVECVDQELIVTNAPTLASGGICENVVSFKFCNKWDGFSKTAVFYQNEKNVYYALIDSQNKCEIPYEVTLNEGTLHFGVFGVNGDTRRTSKVEKIRIHKGAWNSDMHPSDPTPDIYSQLLSKFNEVNELLISFLNGTSTTPVGNAKTLEGHGADYFATAVAVQNIVNGTTPVGALGTETAEAWQTKMDNIQTTSRATLSQAGWYRVAEYVATVDGGYLNGAACNSCVLEIKRVFGNNSNENHVIRLKSSNNLQEFIPYDCFSVTHLFKKIRYTHDGSTTAYLEVYYSGTKNNLSLFIVNSPLDASSRNYAWKAITPTLTSETADGVTVTTTYDIPANASPATSKDLANYLPLNGSKAMTGDLILGNDGVGGRTTLGLRNAHRSVNLQIDSNGNFYAYDITNSKELFLSNKNSANTWYGTATGNLPLTGGTVDGHITVEASSASSRALIVKNSLREINLQVQGDGNGILRDATNGKNIITSTLNGTNTFNGTATGNLPLNGGTMTDSITYKATDSVYASALGTRFTDINNDFVGGMGAFYSAGTFSHLYFSAVKSPHVTSNGLSITADTIKWKDNPLLHTGNSAKVVVSSTPLTEDGAVRVW